MAKLTLKRFTDVVNKLESKQEKSKNYIFLYNSQFKEKFNEQIKKLCQK